MLACAAAVALAVVVAAAGTYWYVRDVLRGQIDASLRAADAFTVGLDTPAAAGGAADVVRRARLETGSPLDGPVLFRQLLAPGGRVEVAARRAARGAASRRPSWRRWRAGAQAPFFADVERDGRTLRVLHDAHRRRRRVPGRPAAGRGRTPRWRRSGSAWA